MDPFSLDIAAAFSPAIPITFMACKEAQNASDETARNAPIGALIMSKVLAVHCFCIILLIKGWTKIFRYLYILRLKVSGVVRILMFILHFVYDWHF